MQKTERGRVRGRSTQEGRHLHNINVTRYDGSRYQGYPGSVGGVCLTLEKNLHQLQHGQDREYKRSSPKKRDSQHGVHLPAPQTTLDSRESLATSLFLCRMATCSRLCGRFNRSASSCYFPRPNKSEIVPPKGSTSSPDTFPHTDAILLLHVLTCT